MRVCVCLSVRLPIPCTCVQDLLWSMTPQWHYLTHESIEFPRRWQVHNHCFGLDNLEGVSGTKVSQWKHFKCMQDAFGEDEYNFMPESYVLTE